MSTVNPRPNAIEIMAQLEGDAFVCARDVATVQLFLNIVASLMGSLGLGLLLVSVATLTGWDVVRFRPFQVTLVVAVLLWAPLAILMIRLTRQRSRGTPETEFRAFLDRFPGTAGRPVQWSKINYSLRGMDDELLRIYDDPGLRQRIVASFGLRNITLGLPLVMVGLALAGATGFTVIVAAGSMTTTVNLLILPVLSLVALGMFRFYLSTF